MRRKNRNRRSVGKVITAALVGSVIGATVGLLMAPTSGQEMRRRMKSQAIGVREELKTVTENVESRARELAEDVKNRSELQGSGMRRKKVVSPPS